MSSVNKQFLNDLATEVASGDLNAWFSEMEYQGFDPEKIKNELIKRKWNGEELKKLLVFYCVRGTNTGAKASGRSTDECKKLLSSLANKGLKRSPVASEDLSVGRIVATFPDAVATLMVKYGDKCRIIARSVGKLPDYLKFSAGASLCKDNDQLKEWVLWAIEQDKVINPNKPDAEKVKLYAAIQFSSSQFDTKARETLQKKLDKM